MQCKVDMHIAKSDHPEDRLSTTNTYLSRYHSLTWNIPEIKIIKLYISLLKKLKFQKIRFKNYTYIYMLPYNEKTHTSDIPDKIFVMAQNRPKHGIPFEIKRRAKTKPCLADG